MALILMTLHCWMHSSHRQTRKRRQGILVMMVEKLSKAKRIPSYIDPISIFNLGQSDRGFGAGEKQQLASPTPERPSLCNQYLSHAVATID